MHMVLESLFLLPDNSVVCLKYRLRKYRVISQSRWNSIHFVCIPLPTKRHLKRESLMLSVNEFKERKIRNCTPTNIKEIKKNTKICLAKLNALCYPYRSKTFILKFTLTFIL